MKTQLLERALCTNNQSNKSCFDNCLSGHVAQHVCIELSNFNTKLKCRCPIKNIYIYLICDENCIYLYIKIC